MHMQRTNFIAGHRTVNNARTLGVAALVATIAAIAAGASAAAPIAATAAAQSATGASWEVGLGDKVPTPIMATAVKGRMPAFNERGITSVLVFFSTQDAVSRQALSRLDAIAQRFGKQAAVVAITDEPVSTLREFTEKPDWSGRLNFVLAADPNRQAFRSFFGPQRAPQLPIAYVMKGGTVQWVGLPMDLEPVVTEVVADRWDIAAARRAAAQQQLWDSLMREVDALARGGNAEEALHKLDQACESAMDAQKAQCQGHRFTIFLAAKRIPEAIAIGEQILAKPANDKQAAGIAWSLINAVPGNHDALAFALKAAQASDRALKGRDAMVGAILARAYFLSDRRTEAVETARRALGFADGPDLVNALREDLRVYEGATKSKVPGASGAASGSAAGKPK